MFESYVNELPPVNPQELKYCDRNICVSNEYNGIGCDECKVTKKSQEPFVTPQSKIGLWIIVDDCEKFIAKCSECGEVVDSRMISKYPYCHCGAKMIGLAEVRNEK